MVFELDTVFLILNEYGLVGLFAGSFIQSLVIFPGLVEALIPVFLALQYNPYLVFVAALAGSVLGGFVNYLLGSFGSKFVKKNHEKIMKKSEKWLNRWGPFSIFVTSFIPAFPFDIIAVAVGLLKMNFRQFFISMVLGKATKTALVVFGFQAFVELGAYFGFY
jgi:membrane protein YqaA with SNARE-associated domain